MTAPESTRPARPPGAVTLLPAELDALRHVLDFTSGAVRLYDPAGATVLAEASAWLRDLAADQAAMVVLDLGRPDGGA